MGVGGGMIRCNRFFSKNASELEYGLQDAKVATGELAFLRGICAVLKKAKAVSEVTTTPFHVRSLWCVL